MAKYVALLRGVNVGGNNKIEMAKLKTSFESLGYSNVVTYINSGNVIFETKKTSLPSIIKAIEQVIRETFHVSIRVILRDQTNIAVLCKKIPSTWTNDKDMRTDVMFLSDTHAHKNILKTIPTNPEVDSLLYIEGAVVWHFEKKNYRHSKLRNIIGTDIYKNMTIRNSNTVRKLHTLLQR